MKSGMVVKYNEDDATRIISDMCESFTWTDNAGGTADTISMQLQNMKQRWMRGYMPDSNDYIRAWIEVRDWPGIKDMKQFCGRFYVDLISFSGYPERASISGISVPINNGFVVRQRRKTWKKTTVKAILGDIAKRAGIRLQFDARDHKVDSITQSGQTDADFAFGLCTEYDKQIKLYNQKMVVYDQLAYEKKKAKHTIKRSQLGGDGSYSIKRQVTKVYNSVKIQYTSGKNKALTYEFKRPGTKGTRQMYVTSKAESLQDAEQKAKAALRKSLRQEVTGTIRITGNPAYVAAETVELKEFGKMDGKYFIDKVAHNKAGKYTTTLTIHRVVTDF